MNSISLGTYGGIMSASNFKTLHQDGRVTKETSIIYNKPTVSVNLSQVSSSDAQKIFDLFTPGICSFQYYKPCNMCHIITLSKESKKYSWAFGMNSPPEQLSDVFVQLHNFFDQYGK
jgi:hypothetical protein